MAKVTFTSIYNEAVKSANSLQKKENLLVAGKYFKAVISGAEKRMDLSNVNKSELSSELDEVILDVFGRPMPQVFALNIEAVTDCIERVNAFNKRKEDSERLSAKAETERIAAKAAKDAEIAEKRAAGIAAGKIKA
jgi:hypothetical protein